MRRAHQVSTDMRMVARGPRPGSDEVAVLAVDERSVQQEGRWPWPRGKIKEIIERLVDGGAKVIAFDMIFSEPDKNAGVLALEGLKEKYKTQDSNFYQLVDQEISQANTDKDLAASVEKYTDNLIIGTYFDQPFFRFIYGYQNLCVHQLFLQSPGADAWLNQNVSTVVIPIDQTSMTVPDEIPEVLGEQLTEHFSRIEEKETKEFLNRRKESGESTELTKNLKIQLENHIKKEQLDYCSRWLISPEEKDEFDHYDENYENYVAIWDEIIEEDESLANFSPRDGFKLFRQRQFNSEVLRAGRWWLNLPGITEATTHMAYFNAFLDHDGVVRSSNLVIRAGNTIVPSLAFRSYLVAKERMAQVIIASNPKNLGYKGVSTISVTDLEGEEIFQIPTNNKAMLKINYAGPRMMFPHLSVADVLSDSPNVRVSQTVFDPKEKDWLEKEKVIKKSEFYKDKIFVFGATATGIYDLRVTPFDENFPGVETHANIIDNLLRRDFLVKHPSEEIQMILFITIAGIVLSFLIGRLGAIWGLALISISLASIYFVDRYYIFGQGIVIAIVFPFFLFLGLYFTLTIYKYFTEERSKKHLKGTFGKYVSPAIVDEILSDPSKIELGGSKEHITVFFSDVRGFTTISEKLDASALSDLLNSYLTPMTDIIFKNKGTLDKYMGDAIMAFFGAPVTYNDHAKYACRSALQNIDKLKELQKEYQRKGLPMIDVGIGLNTGEMSVGNMGSETVRNYTVMGDAVNLGARLEGINKQYGTRVIISEFTEKEIRGDFLTREIDWVRVKGKAEPVRIYELMHEGKTDTQTEDLVKYFNDGFNHYHEQRWNQALACFAQGLDINPSDAVSKLYVQRCKDFQATPPPEKWDGVFVMTTK